MKIKLTVMILALGATLTACTDNIQFGNCWNDESTSQQDLPITVYTDEMQKVTEAETEETTSAEDNNSVLEETDGSSQNELDVQGTAEASDDPNSAYNSRKGYNRFVPQNDIPVTDNNFADFTIGGVQYSLLYNTVSDIIEGNNMVSSSQKRSLTDNEDYYFMGDCFRQDNRNGVLEVYVQQMLDGEPVMEYSEENGDDYELYGVRVDAVADSYITDEAMTFACGIKLYMTIDEVEALLGKGTVGAVDYKDYPTYYYKSEDVTLCIVYTRYEDNAEKPLRARRITLVRNKTR